MKPPETVTEAVRRLEADGYRSGFRTGGGAVECRSCGYAHAPAEVVVRHVFRFEGPTDPADEAIVLGVECRECGYRGVVVSAYGPDADQELLDLVDLLGRGREESADPS
ncbi:MAG: hypothetical protein AMXMBFR46_05050 [Acidimicrobiia bacterium]